MDSIPSVLIKLYIPWAIKFKHKKKSDTEIPNKISPPGYSLMLLNLINVNIMNIVEINEIGPNITNVYLSISWSIKVV